MPLELRRGHELAKETNLSILIYGDSGTGKSTRLATFGRPEVKGANLAVFCTEKNSKAAIIAGNPNAIVVVCRVDPKNKAVALSHLKEFLDAANDGTFRKMGIDTLGFDSATALQLKIVDWVEEQAAKRKTWDGTMAQRDWGVLKKLSRKLLTDIRDLEYHTVLIALEKAFSSDTEPTKVCPELEGSATAKTAARFFSVCARSFKQEIQAEDMTTSIRYGLQVQAGQNVMAKGCVGVEGPIIDLPGWQIVDNFRAGLTSKK